MQKKYRLKKNRDFRRIYNQGKSTANRELVIFVKENPNIEYFRLGISVSKKIGKAVVRNRIKRLIKETFRLFLNNHDLKRHLDIVIIARNPTSSMDYSKFERSVKDLLKKSNILVKR